MMNTPPIIYSVLFLSTFLHPGAVVLHSVEQLVQLPQQHGYRHVGA